MSHDVNRRACAQAELVCAYALQALPSGEERNVRDHLASCAQCQAELQVLRSAIDALAYWPADVLRPTASLWNRLARRISADTGSEPVASAARQWAEPEWDEVAEGISCKFLAADTEKGHVSMLVRLAPGAEYPPHQHAGLEELHLLDGELWINDRKLYPGDYNRAEPGTRDTRVWSETGCTCVLITSANDVLS